MSDCIAHGLYHPNCQDSHTTYFGDFLSDDEDEEDPTELPENEVKSNTDSAEYLLQQYTPEEQERNIELYNAEQRLNHCERQVRRFERLEEFSLDGDNKRSYGARRSEWNVRLLEAKNTAAGLAKSVANSGESGIIESQNVGTVGNEVHFIGKIDREIFKCVTEDITTDEVIITDERIEHINKRHPNHFSEISPYLERALKAPDYILSDSNKNELTSGKVSNTGLILKQIYDNGIRMQIVLRIHTSSDDPNYKNSIISAWIISESRWENYLRNKEILYKSE